MYWLRPTGTLTRLHGGRRAAADVLLTMATIVMAILWKMGAAALLGWNGQRRSVNRPLPSLRCRCSAGESHASALLAALDAAFDPVRAAGLEVVVTSNPIINHSIITAIQDSQVTSLAITLGAVLLLLMASFWLRIRRPLLGVITTLPVVLALLWTYGMMAATDIPFGPVTAMLAAIAVGIGIPYSIHVTNRFLEDRLRFGSVDAVDAVRSTVRHTGGALAGSALTTCAGFGVLVTSSLIPFRQMGLVTVYAIGFALVGATLVLPSALVLWDRWHRRRTDTQLTDTPSSKTPPTDTEQVPAHG